MKYSRMHIIVMDSAGIGAAPDADQYGDQGCSTLGHIAENTELKLPNLEKLGLGAISLLQGIKAGNHTAGYACRLQELSAGKDTMTGHWEMMGLITAEPFHVFPDGFQREIIEKLEQYSGRKVVCNRPYSGTEVIKDYGSHQISTGDLIVYTSADSVLQIAAHEEVIPLEELYDICQYARSITLDLPNRVGRVIARPYTGSEGHYRRTPNRHDYALSPPAPTVLDSLKEDGYEVMAVGKIHDIFNGYGITQTWSTRNNMDGIDRLLQVMQEDFTGISFTNLVDFDALYGHRRDVKGYAQALEAFDRRLPEIIDRLWEDDLLMITADHGNDPVFHGTDHTREYVPLLVYRKGMKEKGRLPDGYFSDIAQIIRANFWEGPDHGRNDVFAMK